MTLPIGTSYRLTHGRLSAQASPQARTCACRTRVVCPACRQYARSHQLLAPSAGQLAGRTLSREEVQVQWEIATERLATALAEVPVYRQRVQYWRARVRMYTQWLDDGENAG